MDMEQIANFLSAGLLKQNYQPDQFLNTVADNITELKKHGLYPAPSVVEGELPVDSNLVYSTFNERTKHRSRVAMRMVEIENQMSVDLSSVCEASEQADSRISQDKVEVGSYRFVEYKFYK